MTYLFSLLSEGPTRTDLYDLDGELHASFVHSLCEEEEYAVTFPREELSGLILAAQQVLNK